MRPSPATADDAEAKAGCEDMEARVDDDDVDGAPVWIHGAGLSGNDDPQGEAKADCGCIACGFVAEDAAPTGGVGTKGG